MCCKNTFCLTSAKPFPVAKGQQSAQRSLWQEVIPESLLTLYRQVWERWLCGGSTTPGKMCSLISPLLTPPLTLRTSLQWWETLPAGFIVRVWHREGEGTERTDSSGRLALTIPLPHTHHVGLAQLDGKGWRQLTRGTMQRKKALYWSLVPSAMLEVLHSQNPEEMGRDTGRKTGSIIASYILAWPFFLKKIEVRSQIPLPAIHGSDPRLRAICSSVC